MKLSIWNNKRKKPVVGNFVACKYIPTGIGVITEIPTGEYKIATWFRDQTGLNFKYHIVKKNDISILPYNEVPGHILTAYSSLVN